MPELRTFGPVPSRRLGRSLGINNIPPKICSYSCVYCQLGRSLVMTSLRKAYYPPEELLSEVKNKLRSLQESGQEVDYLCIVPDGEPTLDINLGKLINLLKPLRIPIAVITNSSLLHQPDVRQDLTQADWVSIKVDAVNSNTWKKIDRPHGKIDLDQVLSGVVKLADEFGGQLVTETMLVKDVNDHPSEVQAIARFLAGIHPVRSYLSIPTRPPAENWVQPPGEDQLTAAFQIFTNEGLNTEYLIGYEGCEFSHSGNLRDDLLSIIAVHPMREDAVLAYVKSARSQWSVVQELIEEGKLVVSDYQGHRFYLRKLSRSKRINSTNSPDA